MNPIPEKENFEQETMGSCFKRMRSTEIVIRANYWEVPLARAEGVVIVNPDVPGGFNDLVEAIRVSDENEDGSKKIDPLASKFGIRMVNRSLMNKEKPGRILGASLSYKSPTKGERKLSVFFQDPKGLEPDDTDLTLAALIPANFLDQWVDSPEKPNLYVVSVGQTASLIHLKLTPSPFPDHGFNIEKAVIGATPDPEKDYLFFVGDSSGRFKH